MDFGGFLVEKKSTKNAPKLQKSTKQDVVIARGTGYFGGKVDFFFDFSPFFKFCIGSKNMLHEVRGKMNLF